MPKFISGPVRMPGIEQSKDSGECPWRESEQECDGSRKPEGPGDGWQVLAEGEPHKVNEIHKAEDP